MGSTDFGLVCSDPVEIFDLRLKQNNYTNSYFVGYDSVEILTDNNVFFFKDLKSS